MGFIVKILYIRYTYEKKKKNSNANANKANADNDSSVIFDAIKDVDIVFRSKNYFYNISLKVFILLQIFFLR